MSDKAAIPSPAPRTTAEHSSNHAIDGLRAVAILSVMAVHAGVPGAHLGWLGVDLFFVLSGFLITTLLVAEHRRTGQIKLGRFWLRRFLRLMPAYWLYAGVITLLFAVLHVGWRTSHGGYSPAGYMAAIWLYFINLVPQGGIWEFQSLSLHLWSLAVEEQFYLVWPLLCFLLIRSRRLEAAAWLLSAGALLRLTTSSEIATLDGRGFGIIFGCATALRVANSPAVSSWLRISRPAVPWLVGGGFLLLTALDYAGVLNEEQQHRFTAPILVVGFAALIAQLWLNADSRLGKFLSAAPLVYIGKISYGLYLYHMAAHLLTWHVLLDSIEDWNRWVKFFARFTVFVGLTFAIAVASYQGIEQRFLRLKSRFR